MHNLPLPKLGNISGQIAVILASVVTAIFAVARTFDINPVILGDEFIYAMNAKYFGLWSTPVAGNFSNELFSFVYSSTAICGDAFYQCGKIVNGGFFAVFVAILGLLALHVSGSRSAAMIATVVIGLSPASVYVSMFLPETMFFALMALVLTLAFRASQQATPSSWAFVGAALGIASLVKPHAWMAFVAISIFALVTYASRKILWSVAFWRSGATFVLAAFLSRILASFFLSGPSAISFFGQYVTENTVQEVASIAQGVSSADGSSLVGSGEIEGVVGLFPNQLWIHWVSVVSILGFTLYLIVVRLLSLAVRKATNQVDQLSVLVIVWLLVLIIMIVMFTGWITGGGDDHTTRVLLRYYDYAFAFCVVAAVAVAWDSATPRVFVRWGLALPFLATSSLAFAGFHNRLTVQIADAPGLAGVVGDTTIYGVASGVMLLSLGAFASFPRFVRQVTVVSLLATIVPFGFQAVVQYDLARGTPRVQDLAGLALSQTLTKEAKSSLAILSSSRFEATGVALYGDAPEAQLLFFGAGSLVPEDLLQDQKFAVLMNDIELETAYQILVEGDGFKIIGLSD